MNGHLHFLVQNTVCGTCWDESLVNIYQLSDLITISYRPSGLGVYLLGPNYI